jgi:hypothetical protein
VRLTQPVDIRRFVPRELPRERARRVLVLSAHSAHGRQRIIDEACADLGLECERIGFLTSTDLSPELAMAHSDIVVGKARVIVEAMASGRAAYIWDALGGDGWVTPERYELLEADNFGGQAQPGVIDGQRLRADLMAYDRDMGVVNRDLAARNHSAGRHAEQLVALFERLGAPRDRSPGQVRELERLARVARSFEVRAFHLVRENDALRARLAQVDPGFDLPAGRPRATARGGRRARLRRLRELSRESLRDGLRWRAWRLRARYAESPAADLAGENEVLRRRLELLGVEHEELTPRS